MSTTRCKVICNSINETTGSFWDAATNASVEKKVKNVSFVPVYDGSEENKKFFAATPTIQINIGTVNEDAAAIFEQGKAYYVDFSRAEEVPAPQAEETPQA